MSKGRTIKVANLAGQPRSRPPRSPPRRSPSGLPLPGPDCYDEAVNRDKPWVMRTYSGHSSARASNELYRLNLSKGQTGLSVAFDLPTQTGYDGDDPLAIGEVGKVGVPIGHVGDMEALFDGIPLGEMNTSMTINATAAWLLALYVAVRSGRASIRKVLQGTTQNDIIKEYLSRGTYIFPPLPSMRLTVGRHHLYRQARSEVEPDQRLQLSPAGSRRDARAGGRLRARCRDGDPRHRARVGPCRRARARPGGRTDQLLSECRHPLRRGDLQDPRIRAALGSRSRASATASPTRSCAASGTACR